MKVDIKDKIIYKDDIKIGETQPFCCGTDVLLFSTQGRFSVLKWKENHPNFKTCVVALLSIKIPEKSFHWNFTYETAKNKVKLKEYETRLNLI